jgi:hypothetical protein
MFGATGAWTLISNYSPVRKQRSKRQMSPALSKPTGEVHGCLAFVTTENPTGPLYVFLPRFR